VTLLVGALEEQQGKVHFTIGMPGHLLDSGAVDMIDGWARVVYEPLALRKIFPNIDISGRAHWLIRRWYPLPIPGMPDFHGAGIEETLLGLADTVWINVLLQTDSGSFYARQFTLQGLDLLIPLLEGERR
jgi:hypothetical protein